MTAEKVVVVTGAGGLGSGRAVAQRFARDGARVIVSDINREGGMETVRLIEAQGGQAIFCGADVRVEKQVHALIEFAEQSFGGLHVLVNSASAPFRPSQPLEHWADTVQTDLFGTLYATRFAIDAMRRSGGGAIVNFSSASTLGHGRTKLGGSPAYDVAKIGVLRLSTTLASLASAAGIRVNCIVPDWIAVPELKVYFDSLTPQQRIDNGVPSRLTTLDEICEAVVTLATDESLCGRVLVCWSEDSPRLIRWGDPGYAELE
jgi:NAD(P)-dependent dehydrogenase (short-subunit alcohol dehydrogenase family)